MTVVVHIGEPTESLLQQRAEFLNSVASRELLRGKPELERTLSAEPPEKKLGNFQVYIKSNFVK